MPEHKRKQTKRFEEHENTTICVYVHATYAHALHKRTSLRKPLQTMERSVAVAVAVEVRPRPPAVEPRPSVAKSATRERPVRVGEGTG